jgi:hypothetical protein
MRGSWLRCVFAGTASLLAIVLGGASPAMASGNSATKPYYAGVADVVPASANGEFYCNQANLSSACFDVTPNKVITITIADSSGGAQIPARIEFADAYGTIVDGPLGFCAPGKFLVPDNGDAQLDVQPAVLGRDSIPIPPTDPSQIHMACGQPVPVTQGTITVSGPGLRDTNRPQHTTGWGGYVQNLAAVGLIAG